MSIGTLSVNKPVIGLIGSGPVRGVDDGLLGVGFLRRFAVWVDFDRRLMYLAPNRNLRTPHLFDASGLGFNRVAGGYEVNVVLPDTAAASADIHPGDRLIAIDDQPASNFGFVALSERLSRPGRCALTLQRGQIRLVKKLVLVTRL